MNPFDILIIIILVYCVVRGLFRGLVKEVSSIFGVLGGFYAAYSYYPQVANLLTRLVTDEAYRNIPFLTKGGKLYVNASPKSFVRQEVSPYLDKMEIVYRSILAEKIAMELGTPMSSNLALLGFFSAFEKDLVTHKELRNAIDQVTPSRFKEINFKVFDAGFEMGVRQLNPSEN